MYVEDNIRIDKENKRYKRYYHFLGIKFSDGWNMLPEVRRVVITKANMAQRFKNGGMITIIATEVRFKMFLVFLIGPKAHLRVEVCKTLSHDEALETAIKLKDYFKVKLTDFSDSKSLQSQRN